MRLLEKRIIVNKLSLSSIFSRFNSFFIINTSNHNKLLFIQKSVEIFRHASLIKLLGFNFSDAYVCFLKNDTFFNQLKLIDSYILNYSQDDGINIMLAFCNERQFFNIYNKKLVINIMLNYSYYIDSENFLVQIISSLILLIQNIFLSFIDLFLLSINKNF